MINNFMFGKYQNIITNTTITQCTLKSPDVKSTKIFMLLPEMLVQLKVTKTLTTDNKNSKEHK